MNSLFEMRSPLYIKYADGETRLVEALFEHPKGVLYFELFWENDPKYSIHIIEGQIKGEGPWKVGNSLFMFLDATILILSFAKCKVIGDKKRC